MKRMLLILFVSLLYSSLYSQDESIINFYPLHIGDYWQYHVVFDSGFNYEDTTYYGFRRVDGDTLMANGKTYFVIKENQVHSMSSYYEYFRIDTVEGCVMEFREDADGMEVLHDSLDMQTGDIFDHHMTFIGYNIECIGVDTLEYFSEEREVKSFYMPLLTWTYEYKLAYGLGEIYWQSFEPNVVGAYRTSELIYAKINGIEYGDFVNAIRSDETLPNEYRLYQNYPNPFNPTTTISFYIPKQDNVIVSVYDILGREVVNLLDTEMSAGFHTINFDAQNYSSGVYFYELHTNEMMRVKKMILLK